MTGLGPLLTPRGRLLPAQADEAPELSADLSHRLEKSFARGSGHGLLQLGAAEVGALLPPVLGYWRDLGVRYMTSVCTQPDSDDRLLTSIPPPSLEELDARIAPGEVAALMSGSTIHEVRVFVASVPKARWSAICKDCAGAIDSLVELLQGRFSKGVMARICPETTGLSPSPKEVTVTCSCPDWASMCKHVAAVLYGIGARLDERPDLLFTLRNADQQDLIAKAGAGLPRKRNGPAAAKVPASENLSEMFGIDMAPPAAPKRTRGANPPPKAPPAPAITRPAKPARRSRLTKDTQSIGKPRKGTVRRSRTGHGRAVERLSLRAAPSFAWICRNPRSSARASGRGNGSCARSRTRSPGHEACSRS